MLTFKGEGASDRVVGPMVEACWTTPAVASCGAGLGSLGLHWRRTVMVDGLRAKPHKAAHTEGVGRHREGAGQGARYLRRGGVTRKGRSPG